MCNNLVYVDGSAYTDYSLETAIWAAGRLNTGITVLHVVPDRYDDIADHTGVIGIQARPALKAKLASLAQIENQVAQERGELILDYAQNYLHERGYSGVMHHKRGDLASVIQSYKTAPIIFLGKHGATPVWDATLVRVARNLQSPLYLVSRHNYVVKNFLIGYDGSPHSDKAIEFVCTSPLLKHYICHIIGIDTNKQAFDNAVKRLQRANYSVIASYQTATTAISAIIQAYSVDNKIDLLVLGYYSGIRQLLFGSTAIQLIKTSDRPVMLL